MAQFQMRLSPVDHIFTGRGGYPINFLFFFRGHLDPVRVKESLDKAVALYLPFRSKLVANQSTYEFREDSSGYAWSFEKRSSAPPMEDLAALSDWFKSAKSVPGEALLQVTLSHYVDGSGEPGSALGVSGSHCVVDGYSYFLFLTAWSKIFKGETPPAPQLDRTLLLPTTPTKDGPFDSRRIFKETGFAFSESERPEDSSKVKWEVLDFPKAELDSVYASAASKTEIRLSLNDVLTAEIWRRFAREHHRAGDRLVQTCAFDYRRVHKSLSPLYFGNAVRGASFEADFSEVQGAELHELALKVSRAVKSVDFPAVLESLECLESQRLHDGLGSMERFHVADPERGFLVTNLSRLPLLELDFGTGVPHDFRILTPAKRAAVVLPLQDGLRVQIAV